MRLSIFGGPFLLLFVGITIKYPDLLDMVDFTQLSPVYVKQSTIESIYILTPLV